MVDLTESRVGGVRVRVRVRGRGIGLRISHNWLITFQRIINVTKMDREIEDIT